MERSLRMTTSRGYVAGKGHGIMWALIGVLVALLTQKVVYVSGQYGGGYSGGYGGGGYGYASPYYFVAPYGYQVSTNPSYLLGYVLQVQSLPTYVNSATYGNGYLPTFYQGYYPGSVPPNYGYPNGPGYGGGGAGYPGYAYEQSGGQYAGGPYDVATAPAPAYGKQEYGSEYGQPSYQSQYPYTDSLPYAGGQQYPGYYPGSPSYYWPPRHTY